MNRFKASYICSYKSYLKILQNVETEFSYDHFVDLVLDEPEAEVFTQEEELLWQPTSIDIVTNRDVEELEIRNSNDSCTFPFSLLNSKMYLLIFHFRLYHLSIIGGGN